MRAIAMALALAMSVPAWAVPMQLVHTGRLFDANGMPLDNTHTLTVSLYDDATTTTHVWRESLAVVFDNGFFSMELGADTSGNPLDDAVFDGTALYVGIAVDTDAEIPTRQRVVSVPYAYRSHSTTHLSGGTVDASELRVNGSLVIDGAGRYLGGSTISGLPCGGDEVPLFDGNNWGCTARRPDWTDIDNIPSELLDGDDADTLDGLTCLDGETAKWNNTNGAWECAIDIVLSEGEVEDYVTNAAIDLAAGSMVDGGLISTGVHYGDADTQAYIGAVGDGNTMNHDRYTDAEALAAAGASDDTNPRHHDRYLDAEAVAAMGAVANSNPLNHLRFTEGQAITAMGVEGNTNALNHQRYQDFEAVNAVGPHYTTADFNTDVGTTANSNPLNHNRFTSGEAISAMGGKDITNSYNHDRYSGAEALADLGPHVTQGEVTAWMGSTDVTNPLNHQRYTDTEALNAMGTEATANPYNHVRFSAADAVTAMGAKLNTNAYNHDRYLDSEALAAMGSKANSNPLHHDRFTDANAVTAMGTKGNANALNHDRYTDALAQAAAESSPQIPSASGWASVVRVQSRGASSTVGDRVVYIDGSPVLATLRSYGLLVIDRATGAIVQQGSYDVFGNATEAGRLAADLSSYSTGHIIVLNTYDEPRDNRLTNGLPDQILRCGGSGVFVNSVQYRSAYALVGICDMGPGTGIEQYSGDVGDDTTAFVDMTVTLRDGGFEASGRALAPGAWFARSSGGVSQTSAWTEVPGMSVTFDLLRPARVDMLSVGTQRIGSGTCHVGYRYVVDGTARGDLTWGNQIQQSDQSHEGFTVHEYETLAAGQHTIALQARNSDTTNWCYICLESGGVFRDFDDCTMKVNAYYE